MMPPATAWGWNPQLLAAGSAFTAFPGTEAATLGKTDLYGLEGADTIDFLAVLAVGEFEIVMWLEAEEESGGYTEEAEAMAAVGLLPMKLRRVLRAAGTRMRRDSFAVPREMGEE